MKTETKAPEGETPVPGDHIKTEGQVSVKFKRTYVGTLGIFYKKNQYTISKKMAELLKDDIEEA
jgi:hypothetical protein